MGFDVGMRVTVGRDSTHSGRFCSELGVIERIYETNGFVGVRLDGRVNEASRYGVFWFAPDDIATDEMEEYVMFGNYQRAEISFLDGENTKRVYHYALFDGAAAVGDMVVVSTGHHGLALAKIVAISNDDLKLITCGREVVARVDTAVYSARKAKEAQLAQLKKKMDQRARTIQERAFYEALADKDPEMKKMLDELKALVDTADAQ